MDFWCTWVYESDENNMIIATLYERPLGFSRKTRGKTAPTGKVRFKVDRYKRYILVVVESAIVECGYHDGRAFMG